MSPEKINAEGFTPEESALMTEGEDADDSQPEPKPGLAEGDLETIEKPEAKPATGKPPEGHVPQGALHEARQQAKEYKGRMEKMEAMFQKLLEQRSPLEEPKKQAEPEIPAYDSDPLGHTKAQLDRALKTIDELKGNFQKRSEQEDQNAKQRSTLEQYGQAVSQFKRQNADYDEAFQFLIDSRDKELAFVHDDASERSNRIQYEEGYLAAAAMRQGKNPGQVFYEMAKARGYKGKQAASEENKLDRLALGQKAAKSNSGGKAGGGDDISLEKLAEMDPDSPEYDKAWSRFEKASRRAER